MSSSLVGQARRRPRRRPQRPRPRTRVNPFTRPAQEVVEVTVPVGALSIYDPIHLGTDENGMPVAVTLAYRNLLAGGEPGAGKSSVLNLIVGHGALSPDCRLWLFDGKRVELGPWRDVADVFVGSNTDHAISKLRELQAEMEIRYAMLEAVGRRKITRNDPLDVILAVIDELAYFTVTILRPQRATKLCCSPRSAHNDSPSPPTNSATPWPPTSPGVRICPPPLTSTVVIPTHPYT